MVIDFNTARKNGKGAGIFLHINGHGATAGCVSVSKSLMIDVVHSLDKGDLIGIRK